MPIYIKSMQKKLLILIVKLANSELQHCIGLGACWISLKFVAAKGGHTVRELGEGKLSHAGALRELISLGNCRMINAFSIKK